MVEKILAMKILAVDTSTLVGSIALADGEKIVDTLELDVTTTYSERLLEAIDSILKKSQWTIDTVQGLVVAVGPGSFTGLRIGIATMKGLASAKQIPLVGISSLEALAFNLSHAEEPVAAIMDAKRKEVYAKIVQFKNKKVIRVWMDETCLSPEMLCEKLKTLGPVWLIGDGSKVYQKMWETTLGKSARFAETTSTARVLAQLGGERLSQGEGKNFAVLAANYLRPPDARIRTDG